jgi:CubicO group peptidase (beta-lactamase class C family)
MANLKRSLSPLYAVGLVALLLQAGSGCATSPKHVFPRVNWEYNPAGLPPKVGREVDVFIRTLDTTSLLVVKSGKVVYEYGDVTEPTYLASARKSLLSMLYGPFVASGTIRLDRTLKDLGMSDVGGLLPIEERATVMDLITARSGVYHPASNDGDLLEFAPKRGSQMPGSYWLYSNWDFNAAGVAFERMTGRDIYDALRDILAVPIGMQDFKREQQKKYEKPERSEYPAYPLWLSARDMARLGYLMLCQGQWQDHQLIPAEWVRRSTSVVTPIAEMHPETMLSGPFGYGYMWWVWDGPFASGSYEGAYTASGAHGQWVSVLPAVDMVVVHFASWSSTGPRHSVDKPDYYRLLDLLTGKRPASEEELRQWKEVANGRAGAFRREVR